jgi:DnaA family protein
MAQQLILDILPPAEPTFDNMVLGANAASVAAARSLGAGYTLYIWGPDGSGRTHLLRACANFFAGQYIAAHADPSASLTTLLAQSTMPACIAVDDVHRLDAQALSALFGLYNRWREDSSDANQAFRLITAGDRAPLQMVCREDVRTRLGWGAVYRLQGLSDEEKLAVLMQHAQDHGIPLSKDVLHWLLTHGSRDIRTLFALLDALDRYALANHRPLTLPLLKTMMTHQTSQSV